MTVALKICGMKYEANVLEVGRLQPDYLGFNFYRQSPRFVGEDFQMTNELSTTIRRVGVFVNEDVSVVNDLVQKHSLDLVQLHGGESPEYCDRLQVNGIAVIKVFLVDDTFDFTATHLFKHVVDYFLFDTKGKFYGGNATKFNWNVLHRYDQSVPFFLAGGISPADTKQIKELDGMNLHAIDVNSGVESGLALKDLNLVKEVIENLKELNDEVSS